MLTVSILRTRLRNQIEDGEISIFGQSVGSLAQLKELHYGRNLNQPDHISYVKLLETKTNGGDWKYNLMGRAESAFHQLNRNGEFYNENNAKWVSTDERREYVYKYSGSDITGQFAMLTLENEVTGVHSDAELSHLNAGTYNFRPTFLDEVGHVNFDVIPWILWGNSEVDATRWTAQDRLDLSLAALADKTFNGLVAAVQSSLSHTPFFENHEFVREIGSASDDVFLGTAENQRFRGSAGEDTVDYSASTSAVTASLARHQGYDGDARGDEYFGVENLTGTQFGDILIGDNGDNLLYGDLGADILSGGHGNDTLGGGSGRNTLRGGTGDDHLLIFNETTEARGGRGEDTLVSAVDRLYIGGHDRFSSLEIFKLTDDPFFALRAHTLIGSDRDETLIGNIHDNTLYGGDGQDELFGGRGDDVLRGGEEDDTYIFDEDWGTDYLTEDGGKDKIVFLSHDLNDLRLERVIGVNGTHLEIYSKTTDDRVYVGNHFSTVTDFRFETLITRDKQVDLTGGLPLTGTDAVNNLQGTAFNDVIDTAGGNDFIYAGSGEDSLIGGSGNDVLWGGDDNDTFVFHPGFGRDSIYESGAYPDGVDSSGDTIAFYGIGFASVRREEWQGNTTLSVVGTDDEIYIRSQSFNYGDGLLVEWVSFDGGPAMSISTLLELE